ncbi:hypothetical protein [Streptomyces sp. NPDC056255]|uniref:hypothetical protein n=1 Tax=Streptomyces sp. NPDC056255 TaxID=3345764 RepID=UPI0035DB567F
MTSEENQTTAATASEGIQQIPAQVTVTQPAAVAEARDKLLAAIGAEAQLVAEKSEGQASAVLAELARAYTLVTSGTAAIAVPAVQARAGAASHSISLIAHVPTNGFYVVPTDPDLVNKDQDMSYQPSTGAWS